jgi:hypothetical protein
MSDTVGNLWYEDPYRTTPSHKYLEERYFTAPHTDFHYCGHCGFWHQGPCPNVKAIEYHRNGSVKRIEYREPY